jgi:hypothetical protein
MAMMEEKETCVGVLHQLHLYQLLQKQLLIDEGFLAPSKLIFAPGRAFLAAQPQTELITTKVVPSFFKAFSTASALYNS